MARVAKKMLNGLCARADRCIMVTEWKEFKRLKPHDFIQHMKSPIVIDGRRIYDPKEFSQRLKFAAIGYSVRHR